MEDLEVEMEKQQTQRLWFICIKMIQHGNFSLLLDNLRAEDEGRYTCRVYSQQGSGETVVQIKDVGYLSCSAWTSRSHPPHSRPWRKQMGDIILALLFQSNGDSYQIHQIDNTSRAELFTAEIPKGNFSLRLKSVRIEDKGVYMCLVFAGGLSANATVVLGVGFSSWHVAVIFFCFAAGSGAVLLFCSLIYYRSKNTDTSSIIWTLQVSLVFCPNICMFLAFMFWGFTEGSLHEAITCCALYILRPVMLMWALRYLKYLQDSLTSWIRFFRITHELTVLTVIVYSVFFAYGWRISARERRLSSGICFGVVVLVCLFLSEGKGFCMI
ncbi:uncharacterized protein LOC109062954 [Cyprinus carpio]|uniref:Uncharacterized protein LOC109062954 n=1 Tax=Cyprinus carpio TaxID=7962 RepID=A0A9Q9VVU4_CYPCA|nr:uncharacterized protein LOC109062954 [Cyprinus carpio]